MAYTPPPYADYFRYASAQMPDSAAQTNTAYAGGLSGTSSDPYQLTSAQWNNNNQPTGDFGIAASGENGLSGGYQGGGDNSTILHNYVSPTMQTNTQNIPQKYQGLLSLDTSRDTSQGPNAYSGFKLNPNVIKNLPSTKFGTVDNVQNLDSNGNISGGMQMINPNLKYYDPNYGWITPKANLTAHETGVEKYAVPVLQGLAGAAFGGLTGPLGGMGARLGLAGVNAAAGIGNGAGWKQTLLGMAPGLIAGGLSAGGMGLPQGLSQLYNTGRLGFGLYDSYKNRNPVGGGMSLYNLYRGLNG